VLRLWLINLLPFLNKYADVAGACCGGCPQCIGAATTGLALEVVSAKPSEPDAD
jgi:hypothetical protein